MVVYVNRITNAATSASATSTAVWLTAAWPEPHFVLCAFATLRLCVKSDALHASAVLALLIVIRYYQSLTKLTMELFYWPQ